MSVIAALSGGDPLPNALLPTFSYCVQSSEVAVREALERLLEELKPLNLLIEEVGTVEIVMAEALNNIVEHAYPPNNPSGRISIKCEHHPDGLHIHIKDYGDAMPDGKLPLGKQADIDVDLMDLPEGGFGWFLIHDLAKDVKYHRKGAVNHLRIRIAVALRQDPNN